MAELSLNDIIALITILCSPFLFIMFMLKVFGLNNTENRNMIDMTELHII